jgi:hypothetical protein
VIHLLAALGAVTFLAVLLLTDAGEIRHRARQARRLLAEAGPWLAAWLARKLRGEFASPSPAHPAARAVSVCGWGHLTEAEAREFDGIAALLKAGVLSDEPQSPAPGREG